MKAAIAFGAGFAHKIYGNIFLQAGVTLSVVAGFDNLTQSFLTTLTAPSKPFYGKKNNVVDILNNFYGSTKAEQQQYSAENFGTLYNSQNTFQIAVTQTIGAIFTDLNLMSYYKANAPWFNSATNQGGSISGTLYNYRNITGISGHISGLTEKLTGLEYQVTGGENSFYSGFVNLVDTPTGFSGGMILQASNDGTGLEFIDATGFLTSEDIAWKVYPDVSSLPSPTTYHGMFAHVHGGGGAAYMAHAGAWLKIWPTEVGSMSFTGLSGTPGNFVANKFLKVTSDGTGIEYADIDFPDSEVSFTGLSGTPGFFTANKFLKVTSDGTGVEYADIDFPDSEVSFTGLSGTPGFFTANKFLKVTSDGTGVEYVDVPLDGSGASFFTGLIDAPSSLGSAGQIVRVNAGGTALEFADTSAGGGGGSSSFSGLSDTPANLENGKYLKVTSDGTGIEFVDIAGGGGGSSSFSGLSDTPANLENGKFLKVTSDGTGIEFVQGLDNPTNASFPNGKSLLSDATNNVFKQIRQGSNISIDDSANGLAINAIIPATNNSFRALTDTPAGFSADKFVKVNAVANALEFSEINVESLGIRQPVGSGFAKHSTISDIDSFDGDMPDHIYMQNAGGTNIQTFSFAQYSQGAYIEYAPSRATDYGSHIKFNDNIEGSHLSNDGSLGLHNTMSLSGFIYSGRYHHEAARNTGVYNQGFRSVLSAGAAEFEENTSIEPSLVNVVGINQNWTQLSFPKAAQKEISWIVPQSLTDNYLEGKVKLSLAWNASVGGKVAWEVVLQSYALGDDIDKVVTSSHRSIVGASPGAIANALCQETLEFIPLASEIKKGEMFRVILRRKTSDSQDTLTQNANVLFLSLVELI